MWGRRPRWSGQAGPCRHRPSRRKNQARSGWASEASRSFFEGTGRISERGAQGGEEGGVAGEVAEHPQNIGCLVRLVDGRGGCGERLAGTLAGAGWLCEGEGGAGGFENAQGGVAALLLSTHRVLMNWATPFVEARRGAGAASWAREANLERAIWAWVRAWTRTPSKAPGMALEPGSRRGAARRAPVSKGASSGSGRSSRVRGERGCLPSQPSRKGVTDEAAVVQKTTGDVVTVGEGEGGEVGAGVGGARWRRRGWGPRSRGWSCRSRKWRWRRLPGTGQRVTEGSVMAERTEWPFDEGDGGGLAVREFDGEAEAEARAGEPQLVQAESRRRDARRRRA